METEDSEELQKSLLYPQQHISSSKDLLQSEEASDVSGTTAGLPVLLG